MNSYKEKFESDGFFKVNNFLNIEDINAILEEIKDSKNVDIYKDRNNKIRRIERIYDKGETLIKINEQFIDLIKKHLDLEVLLFKDKFNMKPPGGEGFGAHYDGIFHFIDSNNNIKNGWYEYGNSFLSVLLSLDDSNQENGTLEIAKSHSDNFDELLKNTKNDGSPDLLESIENKTSFEKINLNAGDLLIFKNTCPHRSDKNSSKFNRRILYYTYLPNEFGNQYENYFRDKNMSKNKTSKSLSGKI